MTKRYYWVLIFSFLVLVGGGRGKAQAASSVEEDFNFLDAAKWSVDTQDNYNCVSGLPGSGSDVPLGAQGIVEAKDGKLYLYRDVNCAHRFVYVSSTEGYKLDTPFFEADVSSALENPTGWGVGWGIEGLFRLWYTNSYTPLGFEWVGPDGEKRQVDLPLNLQTGFHKYKVSNLQVPGNPLRASFKVFVDDVQIHQEDYNVTPEMLTMQGRSGKIWLGNPVLGQCDGWHSCRWANGTLDETGAGPWPKLVVDRIKVDGHPVVPLPYLNVSPTTVNLSATEGTGLVFCGGVGPGACPVVYNTGGGTLAWTAFGSPDGWLWWNPTSHSGNSITLSVWAKIDGLTADGLFPHTYQKQITVSGAAGTQNSPQTVTINLTITPPPTGKISGYVWNDLNGDGDRDGGESNIGGVPVSWGTGSTTTGPGVFVSPDLPVGAYTVTITLAPGWSVTVKSCPGPPTPSCANINVTNGGTTEVWFGIWTNPAGWLQVRNGDVYGQSISISLPTDPPGTYCAPGECYDRWFLDADPDSRAGGVVAAAGAVTVTDNRISQRGWNLINYGNIPWPAAIDEIDAHHRGVVSGEIVYGSSFTISAANVSDYNNKIVVAENSLTIKNDVTTVNAVLIVKSPTGSVLIEDRGTRDEPLTVNGALYARGSIIVAGGLRDNRRPALLVKYDPQYLLREIPGLTKARISWKEVKSP
jgi:hypothetical protein